MLRHRVWMVALAAAMVVACGKKGADAGGAAASAPAGKGASAPAVKTVLLVSPEDVLTVGLSAHASGPVITGSIQPERKADLRAEIGAVVLQVLKDNGEAVRKGELLVRLDDTAIRDSLASAEASARASRQALEQSERTLQRLKTLQAQGMSSNQAVDDAEVRRNNAQSDLVAAEARVATAQQQRTRTEVRAPFDGLVSDRKISGGDTAQVGRELLKVIDPASLRFEGMVAADRLSDVKAGQAVQFRVNGQDARDYLGKVRRVDAAADAATRQLSVVVDFAPGTAPRLSGLYAEGRIATGGNEALVLPEAAIVREGDKASVWRLGDGKLVKTEVQLGERDARRGDYVIVGGLQPGARVLRAPGSTLTDGQPLELGKSAAPAAALTASAASR